MAIWEGYSKLSKWTKPFFTREIIFKKVKIAFVYKKIISKTTERENPNDLHHTCMYSEDSKLMKSGSPDLNWVPKSMFNNQLLGLKLGKCLKLVNFDQDNVYIFDVGIKIQIK